MKWLAKLFSRGHKQATAYDISSPFERRKNEEIQMAKQGVSNKPEFSVRILYPRHNEEINVVDLYAYILYEKLLGLKKENIITEVWFDRNGKDGSRFLIKRDDLDYTRKVPVYKNIVDPFCLIIIVIPGIKNETTNGILDAHETLIEELYLCKAIVEKNLKSFFTKLKENDFSYIEEMEQKDMNLIYPIWLDKFDKKNIVGKEYRDLSDFLGGIAAETIPTVKDYDCVEKIKERINDVKNNNKVNSYK